MTNFHKTVKIDLIGDSCVGKSWLFAQFLQQPLPNFQAVGVDFGQRNLEGQDNELYRVQLFDYAHRTQHIPRSPVLLVFDLTRQESLNNALRVYLPRTRFNRCSTQIPVFLVGNKCDLEEEREISFDKIQILSDELGLTYTEVSAKDGVNVDSLFLKVLEQTEMFCFQHKNNEGVIK